MICALMLVFLCRLPVGADEGMWLMNRLNEIYPLMRAEGLKLEAGELYNEQSPGLSDAVVAVDGGMGTGSMISREGLMITNHHVAYSDICALSTPEHNYLENGFWARTREEEIPVAGKTVSFLRKIVDVTAETQQLKAEMKAQGRWGMMATRRLYSQIEERHKADTPYEVVCASMWGGKKYYLFYYEVYRDVRLVGAPPERIGAFGGDIDNWGWPQHKGDFALYRVYADAEGRPADYSPGNVPLEPRRVLSISTRGVHDGDFSMVIGFPGRTNRYASSFFIREKQLVRNPVIVANRSDRMEIIKRHMERDPEVRMKYSDAYFGLSNYADYARWETKCLRRFDVARVRADEERDLRQWIDADPERKAEYGTLLDDLARGYEARKDAQRYVHYFREAWLGPCEALLVGNRIASYLGRLERMKQDTMYVQAKDGRSVVNNVVRIEKNYDRATDRDLFVKMAENFTANVPRDMWGDNLNRMYDAAGGDAARMAGEAFDASFCSDPGRYKAFFAQNRSVEEIRRDPLVALAESVRIQQFTGCMNRCEQCAKVEVNRDEARYAGLLYDFRAARGVPQYPNANSSMRLTYGSVGPIDAADAVHYDSRSTIAGYTEKYNPEAHEFRVDDRMRALIAARDWGRWGEKGQLYVDFLTDNDITGGNSGSPVLDARGRIIGLAFDGNRESMANDVWFHPQMARTVCVDIRFVMWIIDKYAGAGYLLDEMQFEK